MKFNVHIEAFNEKGECIQTEDVHNTVTTVGKRMIAETIGRGAVGADANLGRPGWISDGIGQTTDSLEVDKARTAMVSPVFSDRLSQNISPVNLTFVMPSGTGTGIPAQAIVTYTLPLGNANNNNIYEVGLLTAAHSGTYSLFARATHSLIVKNATVEIKYTWTFTF